MTVRAEARDARDQRALAFEHGRVAGASIPWRLSHKGPTRKFPDSLGDVSRITEWAGRRWTDRFPAGVNPALRLSDTITEGTIVYSTLAKEVENRRIELRIALSSLGADDALLRQLTEFEDAAGMLGVLIGASMETEDIDPGGTTPEADEHGPGDSAIRT